jgi:microcystin-dependent protein
MSERRTVYKDASTGVGGLGPSQSQTYVDGTKLMGQSYGNDAKEIIDLASTAPIIPIGVVNPFAGGTAPTGWLLCDASEVSQTSYPLLYALLGTTWGTAASGNFKLPDLRGRVITGADGGAGRIASNNTLGDDGGAEDVSLTTAQLPSHSHANTASGSGTASTDLSYASYLYSNETNTGNWNFNKFYSTGSGNYKANLLSAASITATTTVDSLSISMSNANTGSGNSHSNLQPYAIFNHIIKHD